MDFAVRPGFSEDGKKIVLVAQGGYWARVALEDIRKEFGVSLSDELLHDLASQREANRRTLSEIATDLFEGSSTLWLMVTSGLLILAAVTWLPSAINLPGANLLSLR